LTGRVGRLDWSPNSGGYVRFLVLATAVLLLGFTACDTEPPEVHDLLDNSFDLDAGAVRAFGFGLQQGTRVFGTWSTTGGPVKFYVLDETNHTAWENGQTFSYRATAEGDSGSVSFKIPGRGETYYYSFDNRSGGTQVSVTVSLDEEK
jgi:hypothetical protein